MNTMTLTHTEQKISIKHIALAFGATLQLWVNRHEQRKQLAKLPVHLLEDLGLNSEAVKAEVNKPFWI